MTVRTLIEILEGVEDKDLEVIVNSHDYGDVVAEWVIENAVRYYYVDDEKTFKDKKCLVIEG